MRLIFDADPVVYGAGFASEQLSWLVVAEDAEGNLIERHFLAVKGGAKTAANKWLLENSLEAVSWEKVITPEPVEFALQAVNTTIRGAIRAVAKRFNTRPHDLTLTVLLSGPGNWREEVATIAPYKGNRDPTHKPYWYQQIRTHLVEKWGANVIHGREADDEASIIAEQHIADGDASYVVCTIDKDLDQIPGHHYDYKKHVHYEVPLEHAERWFWVQVLSGDPTDNIPGCYGISTKKAEDLIDKWDSLPLPKGTTRDQFMWQRVCITYKAAEDARGATCPWVGKKTAAEAALETARLVRMQKHVGELWEPPCHV
jgi:hypothetical protein